MLSCSFFDFHDPKGSVIDSGTDYGRIACRRVTTSLRVISILSQQAAYQQHMGVSMLTDDLKCCIEMLWVLMWQCTLQEDVISDKCSRFWWSDFLTKIAFHVRRCWNLASIWLTHAQQENYLYLIAYTSYYHTVRWSKSFKCLAVFLLLNRRSPVASLQSPTWSNAAACTLIFRIIKIFLRLSNKFA